MRKRLSDSIKKVEEKLKLEKIKQGRSLESDWGLEEGTYILHFVLVFHFNRNL